MGNLCQDWSSFWKSTETTGYKTLDINLAASIRITRLAIKSFLGREEGSEGVVVNISSLAGQRASFYCPLYTASKWAISGFTRALATLDREMGIKVVAVAPGIVRTPLWTDSPKVFSCFNFESSSQNLTFQGVDVIGQRRVG